MKIMTVKETRSMKFELRDIDSRTGQFEGIISTRKKDTYGTIIEPTAFTKSVKEQQGKFVVLLNHKQDFPVGVSKEIDIRKDDVYARAELDIETDIGYRAFSGVKKGYLDDLSIGFKRIQSKYDKRSQAVVLTEIKLMEFSILPTGYGSTPGSGVTGVRSVEEILDTLDKDKMRVDIFNWFVKSLNGVDIDKEKLNRAIQELQQVIEPVNSTQEERQQEEPVPTTQKIDDEKELEMKIKQFRERWSIKC